MDSLAVTVAVLAFASAVHGAFGFGAGLVAMPLLALGVGLTTATPLVALVMGTNIVLLLWLDRAHVEWPSALRLLVATVPGIAVGILMLEVLPERTGRQVLGGLLILIGVYSLLKVSTPRLHADAWSYPFGFIAGVLGGAFNMNAPPLVIYGAFRGWSPDRFRGTLQGYFLPAAFFIAAGHGLAGLWTVQVGVLYLYAIPAALAALIAGRWLGQKLPVSLFTRVLYAVLIALGAILVFV